MTGQDKPGWDHEPQEARPERVPRTYVTLVSVPHWDHPDPGYQYPAHLTGPGFLCPPELAVMLREHIARFGTGPDAASSGPSRATPSRLPPGGRCGRRSGGPRSTRTSWTPR